MVRQRGRLCSRTELLALSPGLGWAHVSHLARPRMERYDPVVDPTDAEPLPPRRLGDPQKSKSAYRRRAKEKTPVRAGTEVLSGR